MALAKEETEEEKDANEEYADAFEESGQKGATLDNIDLKAVLEDGATPDFKQEKAEASDYDEGRFEESGKQPEILGRYAAYGAQSEAAKEAPEGSEPT